MKANIILRAAVMVAYICVMVAGIFTGFEVEGSMTDFILGLILIMLYTMGVSNDKA